MKQHEENDTQKHNFFGPIEQKSFIRQALSARMFYKAKLFEAMNSHYSMY